MSGTNTRFKVLALAGSLRRDSLNKRLLRAASVCAPARVGLELFERLQEVPLFNEDIEEDAITGVRSLVSAVAASDGLIIATPEYNQSLPGVMKNAIDWLSRANPSVLRGKPVAVLGATSGRWGTRLAQAALRQQLAANGACVMPEPAIYVSHAERVLAGHGRVVDDQVREALEDFLASFERWMRRCQETEELGRYRRNFPRDESTPGVASGPDRRDQK